MIVGDIGTQTNWSDALSDVDTVLHLAARVHIMNETAINPIEIYREVNVRGTQCLAEEAAKAGVKRFVFLSSIKVNGEFTGQRAFKETDNERPEGPYAVSKWEAEQVLWKIAARTDMEVTILRAPLIFGPGVKANFLKLIQLVDRSVPLPFGGIRNRRSLMGLTNLVDLICLSLKHPAAANETFLVSDGEDVSTPELVDRIACALGKRSRLLPIPEWMMMLGGLLTGKSMQIKRLRGSLQIDSSKLRRMLGWTPPCRMVEELAKMAKWYRAELAKRGT